MSIANNWTDGTSNQVCNVVHGLSVFEFLIVTPESKSSCKWYNISVSLVYQPALIQPHFVLSPNLVILCDCGRPNQRCLFYYRIRNDVDRPSELNKSKGFAARTRRPVINK